MWIKRLTRGTKVIALVWLGGGLTASVNADALRLADYKFNGNGEDELGNNPAMEVSGFSFTTGTLHLSDAGFGMGYLPGTAKIIGLSYTSFAVALDFKPQDFAYPHWNILSVGLGTRWLGLATDDTGRLKIALNNQSQTFTFTNVLKTNTWHTLVCSVEVASSAHRIVTHLDGEQLPDIVLQGFQFNVPPEDLEQEKVFSFRNFGNATSLSGYVDNLRVYSRALSATEITARYSARLGIQQSDQTVLVYWPAALTGYVLESADTLAPAAPWIPDNRTPLQIGNQRLILEEQTTNSKFFRLRRP